MAKNVFLKIGDARRDDAEQFIKSIYWSQYGACLDGLPAMVMARIDDGGKIMCAAGLRTQQDGFFSESYLDASVEDTLSACSGLKVGRDEIFEVSSLSSLSPLATAGFIHDIVNFGKDNGFAWSFFTITERLARMVQRLHLSPVCLADADPRRIADHERWGNYYSFQPRVYAVANDRGVNRPSSQRMSGYANAV